MKVIEGNFHEDSRGVIRFVNDYDMVKVVRMYCIEPKLGVIRAWQGHKKETKWFYATKGSFLVKTMKMDILEKKEYHQKEKYLPHQNMVRQRMGKLLPSILGKSSTRYGKFK